MRSTFRLLAAVSRSTSTSTPTSTTLYSAPGLPTGLTGLVTHYSPRSTLLYLYSTTLDKLQALPEHSVYRQSAEALTRHRMSIVESIKPAGLNEWQQRVSQLVTEHPEAFKKVNLSDGSDGYNVIYNAPAPDRSFKTEDDAVNAAYKARPQAEGPREQEDRDVRDRGKELEKDVYGDEMRRLRIEAEPALTMEQIGEVEQRIGAGLIEEVIAVAEGERSLVDTMHEYKVWEDLEEKPAEGQWLYNERETS